MKTKLMTLIFAVVTAFVISACADENIQPVNSEGSGSGDECQWGGPGCP